METSLLDKKHPSFGIDQAWFQFAILSEDGSIRKLMLVEAQRVAAVATLEYILSKDGWVSSRCQVVAVFRQCPGIGMRSDIIDELSYVDFMLDIVDPDRLMADAVVSTYFVSSLTNDERRYAAAKATARAAWHNEESEPEPVVRIRTVSQTSGEYEPGSRQALLFCAMTKMGFKAHQVRKWINDNDVSSGEISDQIRAGLVVLAS